MKIVDALWFNQVGIVRVETDEGETKYFIKEISGENDEESDKRLIASWGSTFPKQAGDFLFRVSPCLMYDDKVLYGDRKSLDFVANLIQDRDMNSVRRSAKVEPKGK